MSGPLPSTIRVLGQVGGERARQDFRWGQQDHADGTGGVFRGLVERLARRLCDRANRRRALTFAHILREEFAEALAERDPAKLRAELIQVAAVAVSWIEAIDRRSGASS